MKRNYLLLGISMVFILMVVCISCDKDDKKDDEVQYESDIDDFLNDKDNDNYELAGSEWKTRRLKEEYTYILKFCGDVKWLYESGAYTNLTSLEGLKHDFIFEEDKCIFRDEDEYYGHRNYTYSNGHLIIGQSDDDDENHYDITEGTFTINGNNATYEYTRKSRSYYDGSYDGNTNERDSGDWKEIEEGIITYRLKEGAVVNGSLVGTVWEFVDIQAQLTVDVKRLYVYGEEDGYGKGGSLKFSSDQVDCGWSDRRMYDYVYKNGRLVMKNKYKRTEWPEEGGEDYLKEIPSDCKCVVTDICDGKLSLRGSNGTYDYVETTTETRQGGGYESYTDVETDKIMEEWKQQ